MMDNVMDRACCTHGKKTNAYRVSVRKFEETTDILERGEGGRIILKLYRQNRIGMYGVKWSGCSCRKMAVCCLHGYMAWLKVSVTEWTQGC
jgi:hypothetical protein